MGGYSAKSKRFDPQCAWITFMTFNNTQVTKSTGVSACHWYGHGKVK